MGNMLKYSGMQKKRVVIVGGGFGGIYVAKGLKTLAESEKIEVILINKTNYFLFTPLLHEVATGGLSPISIAEPIREIFRGGKIKFEQAQAHEINLQNKTIKTDRGELNYDFLVLSTGADTRFYDIPGAEEYSLTLKNLADAIKIRTQIIDSFEKAAIESDPKKRQESLTFVVVGGGATGVELVAEIAEFTYETLYPFYSHALCKKNDIKIILISGTEEILPIFPKKLRDWALKILIKKDIEVRRAVNVISVAENEVFLSDQEKIQTQNIFWMAGVKPKPPYFIGHIPREKDRIRVQKTLQMENQNDVFVLGDLASFKNNNEPLPMFAQVTVREARRVAGNIKNLLKNRPLQDFVYKSQGDLISLGQWMAIGNVFGFEIKGRFTWWLWRTIYLFKFASWRKRFRIAFEWTINLFYPRDTTKVN